MGRLLAEVFKNHLHFGIDFGADWFPARNIQLSATGFYERFTNENVTQSSGAGRAAFSAKIRAFYSEIRDRRDLRGDRVSRYASRRVQRRR
jgi:hypothetical protein